MVEKDLVESEVEWKKFSGDSSERGEHLREQQNSQNEPNEDMPHMVLFEIEYEQGLGIDCSTHGFPNKERALEAKSKLDQIACIAGARVYRC